ncbi:MAG: LegC family aminotransferase [Candidatus Omnitrophica bacterium]|nr:LegC family aminotransferase [Candidatus Omnitrophota bacterium]MDD5310553.1 LegC family aminotransferase [Candidatus Omnitrophota bacterium]MDD5546021.1 LegC family aminotransferase [Candidatus Omnitrophota bacterium]
MIPLSVPNLSGRELQYLKKCVETNWVSSSGGFVKDFEDAVCRYVKAKHAVACVNGTAGLHIALALCGAGRDDEVIVPTLTFIAPVNVVKYLGAEPVFMDCDDYLNIDCVKVREFCAKECTATKAGLRNKKTGRVVKAIIPVHIFGNPCDMEELMKIARKYRLKVIEDATESLGAYYTSGAYKGRFTGTVSDIGVYSFNGNKIITTGGGGMIVTDNGLLAKKGKYLTEQAKDDPVKHLHNEVGYNFRLTNLQAAVGLAQLERLKGFIRVKKDNYAVYKKLLKGVKGAGMLGVPEGTAPNYWFYSLVIEKELFGADRDKTMRHLLAKGIQTRPVWYLNHLQRPYLRNQAYKIEKAPRYWRRVLNLPCSTNLDLRQIRRVTSAIRGLGRGD